MSNATATIRYSVSITAGRRKDFDACVEIVKSAGGTFDPATKTWQITAEDGRDGMGELDYYSAGVAHFYTANLTIEAL